MRAARSRCPPRRHHAGAVYANALLALAAASGGEAGVDARVVGDVDGHETGAQLLGQIAPAIGVAIEDRHGRAARGQRAGDRSAQTGGAAGDDRRGRVVDAHGRA